MIRASAADWPQLRAKGAAVRQFAGYAVFIIDKLNNGSVEDELALAISQLLKKSYDTLREDTMFLSATAKREIPLIGRRLTRFSRAISAHLQYCRAEVLECVT